jgi:hypothetical protein
MIDEGPRAAVLILCRVSNLALEAQGDTTPRRLANVLEIGETSLILEIDDPPPPDTPVSINFVVPGTGRRVEVFGEVAQQGPVGCLVKITKTLDASLLDFVRRRVAAGDVDGPST